MSAALLHIQRSATLPLDVITLVEELQPRVEIDRALLDDYAAALVEGAVFPPVIVFHRDGEYLLADGYHRWHTHKLLGLADIAVEVREGDFLDALRFSLAANAAHGKRRQPGDYKRAYQLAVSNGLVGADDVDAVVSTLRCSIRWAQELTHAARIATIEAQAAEQRRRDGGIAARLEAGKTQKQVAEEVGLTQGAVSKAYSRARNADWNTPGLIEQEQQERLERASRMTSDDARQWDDIVRALRAINTLSWPDKRDPDLDHIFVPQFRAALNALNYQAERMSIDA